MAESREYIARASEDGSVNISEDVIGIIALEAMREVEGFGGVPNNIGKDIADFIGKKNAFRGIHVATGEDSVTIEAYVAVKYGHSVTRVAGAVQESVSKAVEDMTGIRVAAVNVHVGSIAFEKGVQS